MDRLSLLPGNGGFSPLWSSLRRRKHGAGGGLTGYAATSWGIQQLFGRPTLARIDEGDGDKPSITETPEFKRSAHGSHNPRVPL